MNTRQIIAKNTILQMFLHFFNLLVGLYSVSLIAKYLGKTAFGKYGFVSSFYLFFMPFLDLGIGVIALREVSKERDKAEPLLSSVITFRLFSSILLAFIAIIITNTFPFPGDLKLALSVYAPMLIFIALESVQSIFEADLRYEYIALSSFFWRISSLLFVLLAVKLNLGLVFIVASFVLAEAIKYMVLYFSAKRFANIKLPTINIKIWIEMVKKAFPIGITTILLTIIRNFDTMMLTKMKGFAEVGLYLASYRLCDMSLCLPLALAPSIFPLMSKFYKQDFNALKSIHQKSFDILSVCGVLLVSMALALGDKVVISIFGIGFIRSAFAFKILIFSSFLIYISIASSSLLIAADRQKTIMWFYLLAAPLSVVLNLILIPLFSFIGAAITNVVVMLLVISLTFYLVRVKLKVPLEIIKAKRALFAGLVTFAVLFYLKDLKLFVSAPIGIFLYGSLVIILRAIDLDDILLLMGNRV